MAIDRRAELQSIRTFPALVAYLRDELGWPIDRADFDELTFEYTPEELGIDSASAANIQEIKRLRPLTPTQPWGIFFVKFEPKKLPVVALRRILSRVVIKKRASANSAERAAWQADDLLFVSNFGVGDERQISFAHFSQDGRKDDLPTLKVLGWDNLDTSLHLDDVAGTLRQRLAWPDDEDDAEGWRETWRSAFTLRHREVITTSRDLSIRLAELARAIRDRIKAALAIETENGALTKLMKAFREVLVHDLDAVGFADMYAQTIAYGLLSSRVADPKSNTADDFAAHMRTNPFLRELMETFLHVGGRRGKAGDEGIDFDELGVSEVVQLLDDANMEAVVGDFGDRNPQEDPVIHFYELFLKEYDAKERTLRGVFYTPRPVVSYIVRSVDELLRTGFGLEDGLADTTTWDEMVSRHSGLTIPDGITPDQAFVQILDPATGTGTFLVEVIDLVHQTLTTKWGAESDADIKALWNEYVARHLLPRLHGYELLMAPYAIAHLKIGLKLYETGYRFGSDERARIYLTNALEPAHESSGRFEFAIPALAHEAHAVNEVKRSQRFTVVLGNPPYSQMSQNLGPAERELVAPYRSIDGQRLVERGAITFERNLQDDYVKFVRLAEILVESATGGVVGLITNHAYLSNITLRGMRHHLLGTFDRVRVIDLHGNSKIQEVAPAGVQDQNVFDIQQGVAMVLLARTGRPRAEPVFSELWGSRQAKYGTLAEGNAQLASTRLRPATPTFLLVPQDEERLAEYSVWTRLPDIFPLYGSAITTARDAVVINFNDEAILARASKLQDARLSDDEVLAALDIRESAIWKVRRAREALAGVNLAEAIVDVDYRPFDRRRLLYHDALVSSPRHPTMDNMARKDSLALACSRQQGVAGFRHMLVSRIRFDEGLVSNRSREKTVCFPLNIYPTSDALLPASKSLNLAPAFLGRLRDALDLDASLEGSNVLSYIYALTHSPTYRTRYAEFLKGDFPRVPIPGGPELFRELVGLGEELVALHLLEARQSAARSQHTAARQTPRSGESSGRTTRFGLTLRRQVSRGRPTATASEVFPRPCGSSTLVAIRSVRSGSETVGVAYSRTTTWPIIRRLLGPSPRRFA